MIQCNLYNEETEVLYSENEMESVYKSELNCTDRKQSAIKSNKIYQSQKSNKDSCGKIISMPERNCTFSIDRILGYSNKLHKNDMETSIANNTTSIKKLAENQINLSEGKFRPYTALRTWQSVRYTFYNVYSNII